MILEMLCLLACGTHAADLQIEGMLSFELKLPTHVDRLPARPVLEKSVSQNNSSQVTAGPVVECTYPYPEKKQVDAILSNLMNVLTKVFVRAHDFLTREDARRVEANKSARHHASRFKVVDQKNTRFFEHIYHNMTHEYSEFFNATEGSVPRSRDPCAHQEELAGRWRELLARARALCRRALEELLRGTRGQRASAAERARLRRFLARELAGLRSGQLHLLCDRFQLCFNDLL